MTLPELKGYRPKVKKLCLDGRARLGRNGVVSRVGRKALAVILVASLVLPVAVATAQTKAKQPAAEQADTSKGEEIGYGVGSVAASIVYTPLKLGYAGLGLLAGGLSYILTGGRKDVADSIIYPATRGDYIIKPDHLKGKEPWVFVGPPPPDAQIKETPLPPAPQR